MTETITTDIHLLCSSKRRGHWIYKFTDEFGLEEYRCTGCGKWAIKVKVPNIEFIVWRDNNMNREETKKKLEEAAELVSTHLGCTNQDWEIKDRIYSSREKKLILVFKVEYEDDEE